LETRRRLGLWRVAATIVPLLAVAFGSFLVGGASVADAATGGSFSLGCSVSSSGGVTTVKMKFTVRAAATTPDSLNNVTFDVVGLGGTELSTDPPTNSYTSAPISVTAPVAGGSWPLELSINGTVVRTGTATVNVTSGGASCRLTSP
jgi:hypothetical protein